MTRFYTTKITIIIFAKLWFCFLHCWIRLIWRERLSYYTGPNNIIRHILCLLYVYGTFVLADLESYFLQLQKNSTLVLFEIIFLSISATQHSIWNANFPMGVDVSRCSVKLISAMFLFSNDFWSVISSQVLLPSLSNFHTTSWSSAFSYAIKISKIGLNLLFPHIFYI